MTTLQLLDDCVTRARALPAVLERSGSDLLFSDELLADLDMSLEHCLAAIRAGEDMSGVLWQIIQLKWLVYRATGLHLLDQGGSYAATEALRYAARCDLHDSRERVIAAQSG